MYEILTDEHPMLRKKVTPVTAITDELLQLADDMIDLVMERKALGLAGNQIGQDVRVFVGMIEEKGTHYARVFFNPEVIVASEEEATFEEGCLSIPKFFESFKRPKTITLRYIDESGETCEEEFTGMNARLVQHETDHLNGILFTDYLGEKHPISDADHPISKL